MLSFISDVVCIMMFILCTVFQLQQYRLAEIKAEPNAKGGIRLGQCLRFSIVTSPSWIQNFWADCFAGFISCQSLFFFFSVFALNETMYRLLLVRNKCVLPLRCILPVVSVRILYLLCYLDRKRLLLLHARNRGDHCFCQGVFCLIGVRCILPGASVCIHTNWK